MKNIFKVMMLSSCLSANLLMHAEGLPFYYSIPAAVCEYTGQGIAWTAGKLANIVVYYPFSLAARCSRAFTRGLLGADSAAYHYTEYGLKGTLTVGIIGGGYLLGRKIVEQITLAIPFVRSVRDEFEKGIESSNPNKVTNDNQKNEKAVWFNENINSTQKEQASKDLTTLKTRTAFGPLHVFGITKSIETIIDDKVNSKIHKEYQFDEKIKIFSNKILETYKVRGLWFLGCNAAAKEAIEIYVRICVKLHELK